MLKQVQHDVGILCTRILQVKKLAEEIIKAQKEEIAQMKALIERLEQQ